MKTLFNRSALAVMLTAAAAGLGAQALTDFGYGRLTVNGQPALGSRPLAVLMVQYGSAPFAHDAPYYDQLFFNETKTSVNGYFLENSHGRFYWQRAGAGIYGVVHLPMSYYDPNPQVRMATSLTAATCPNVPPVTCDNTAISYEMFDANGDGVVTPDELTVLVIENLGGSGVAEFTPNPACFVPNQRPFNICVGLMPMAGPTTSLMSLAHGLMHTLGAVDMFGNYDGENFAYTTMGATIFEDANRTPIPDDTRSFHLDPWHKMLLGWLEPQISSIDSPGSAAITAAQLPPNSPPVILYSQNHGPLEFYMLEFRSNTLPTGATYDANVPGTGLVIWHVQTKGLGGPNLLADMNTVPAYDVVGAQMISAFMNGSPNFAPGQGGVWPPSRSVPYPLTWLDGTGTATEITLGSIVDAGATLPLNWGPAAAPPPPAQLVFAYNRLSLSGATGAIQSAAANFTTLQQYGGSFNAYTHTVSGNPMLLYNTYTGAAAIAGMDASGNFHTTKTYGAGAFATGWTHIVNVQGGQYTFFYNSRTGDAAAGQLNAAGFTTYKTWPHGFSTGWTSIVDTPNGMLFYNDATGGGAVGTLTPVMSNPQPGIFPSLVSINFVEYKGYPAASFSTGWTHIVNTSNGVLFYNAANGAQVMLDLNAGGTVSTRALTAQTIQTGWTSILAVNSDILFYNSSTGDYAIGGIRSISVGGELGGSTGLAAGSLVIRRAYPGGFSTGWSSLASSVPAAF